MKNTVNNVEKNTIELIEKLATHSTLQDSTAQSHAIETADISCELKEALLEQDIYSIETQLGLQNKIKCIGIYPAEDEQEQEDEQEDEQETQNLIKLAI